MECKYGCGKKIKVINFQPRPDKRTNRETSKVLNLGKFKLFYEIDDDGDRGDLHMCPAFQKEFDANSDYNDKLECIVRGKIIPTAELKLRLEKFDEFAVEIMKEEELDDEQMAEVRRFFEAWMNVSRENNEKDGSDIELKQETVSAIDYSKMAYVEAEINSEVFNDEVKLEEKLFELLDCMECHNIFYPIVELGNLYNRKGEFGTAIKLFDLILQWRQYESISSLGKAEAQLQSKWDDKTAYASLSSLDEIFDQLGGGKNEDFMLYKITQGFTAYDKHFVRAKIDYLRAIASMRWDRGSKAKELLINAIKEIEDNFISQGRGKKRSPEEIEELSSEHENKSVLETMKGETGSAGPFVLFKLLEKLGLVTEPFSVYPHMDLYKHTIKTLHEFASQPGNERFIAEAQEFLGKLSKVKRESIDVLEKIIAALKSEIRAIDKQEDDDQLDKLVKDNVIEWKRAEVREDLVCSNMEDVDIYRERIDELQDNIDFFEDLDEDAQDDIDIAELRAEIEENEEAIVIAEDNAADSVFDEDVDDCMGTEVESKYGLNTPVPYWEWQKEIWEINNPAFWRRQTVTYSAKIKIIQNMRDMIPIIRSQVQHKSNTDTGATYAGAPYDPEVDAPAIKKALEKLPKVGSDFSTASIPTKQLSDDAKIAEIEIAFRKLIKRKLGNEKNWEREFIPREIFEKAKKRWDEDELRPHTDNDKDLLDFLELADYGTIFCFHCRNCNYKESKKHNSKLCRKSNWELYFRKVFGGNRTIFLGEIELFRELRNPVAHHAGHLNEDGKADLLRLFTKWNKLLCSDEDKSTLV